METHRKPDENSLMKSLGIVDSDSTHLQEEDLPVTEDVYDIVPDPQADQANLRDLLGVHKEADYANRPPVEDTDLENLAELVPDIKARRAATDDGDDVDALVDGQEEDVHKKKQSRKLSMASRTDSTAARRLSLNNNEKQRNASVERSESMRVLESGDMDEISKHKTPIKAGGYKYHGEDASSSKRDASDLDDYPDSDHALEDDEPEDVSKIPKEFVNMSSNQSISTATQTHEVRMPMYLPTFKPATGCTNASDFVVRCFIARLRAGITVVKHGRSRWCKSRLRVLHIHPDGRSLSWKPAEGEPNSSKRPPKLDLTTCLEVRHAWSPDPQNPMYTGTPILRQKCEAANAHKSFALIFKQRTVDITAVTADQCKVLMEGFSALCFRLQVATLAGRSGGKKGQAMPEEDGVSTTASATLTNSSTPRGR